MALRSVGTFYAIFILSIKRSYGTLKPRIISCVPLEHGKVDNQLCKIRVVICSIKNRKMNEASQGTMPWKTIVGKKSFHNSYTTAFLSLTSCCNKPSNKSSFSIFAPSLNATAGLGCVSINKPLAPVAIAALAIVPIN